MKQKDVILANPLDKNYRLKVTLLVDPSLDKGSSSNLEKKLVLPKKIINDLQLSKVDRIDGVDSKIKFGDSFYGYAQLIWDNIENRIFVYEGDEMSQIRVSRDFAASMMGIEVHRNWKKRLLIALFFFGLAVSAYIALWIYPQLFGESLTSPIMALVSIGLGLSGIAFFGSIIFLPKELTELKKVDAYLNGLKDA
jgi:hypothetical protein